MKTLGKVCVKKQSENKQLIRLLLELESELLNYHRRNGYYEQNLEIQSMRRQIEILLDKIMSNDLENE